jgi:hypothetical protein
MKLITLYISLATFILSTFIFAFLQGFKIKVQEVEDNFKLYETFYTECAKASAHEKVTVELYLGKPRCEIHPK